MINTDQRCFSNSYLRYMCCVLQLRSFIFYPPCHRYLCLCYATALTSTIKLTSCSVWLLSHSFSSHLGGEYIFYVWLLFFLLANVSSSSLTTCPYLTCGNFKKRIDPAKEIKSSKLGSQLPSAETNRFCK